MLSESELRSGRGEMEGEIRGDGKGEDGEGKKKWRVGEEGSRILIEVAMAYAVTKVLLPVRILVSVWATPWFADRKSVV